MKISELIRENTEKMIDTLREADAAAYRNTACEYRVYIDSNGECGHEEWPAGDLGWYKFTDPDYRRYYIHTFCKQYFDIVRDWWFSGDGEPEDYDREAIMEEAIYAATNSADAIDSYEAVIGNAIEYAIESEREAEEENERGW